MIFDMKYNTYSKNTFEVYVAKNNLGSQLALLHYE